MTTTDIGFIESEERQALRKSVAAMAANYGQDYYLEKARSGQHTDELWQETGKLGFIGVNLPEEYGGGGAGMYELSIVMEEMSAGGCPLRRQRLGSQRPEGVHLRRRPGAGRARRRPHGGSQDRQPASRVVHCAHRYTRI